jgi:TonB family protein
MRKWIAVAALAGSLGCASRSGTVKRVDVPVPPLRRPMAELAAALAAPSAEERRAAAWALAGADKFPPEVRSALINLRDHDPDEQVRLAAVWAIGHVALHEEDTGELYDQPPRVVKQPKPVYPEAAFNQNIQGTVDVEILIDEHGNVAHAEVRESIPALDAEALRTVRLMVFQPAMKGGHPVATTALAPVTFRKY